MSFEDLLYPKPYRRPKKGDLPFQEAKRCNAAGTLAADQLARAVFMMDGFMLDDFGGDYSTGTPRQSLPAAGRETPCRRSRKRLGV
jgi:hypothetical protein